MSNAVNTTNLSRTIVKKVFAEETDKAVGAKVRRTIGTTQLRKLSSFLMSVRDGLVGGNVSIRRDDLYSVLLIDLTISSALNAQHI